MPGLVQGMLSGFSKSLADRQNQDAEQATTDRKLQMGVLDRLLGAEDPKLQRIAVQAMTELAGSGGKAGKGKMPKWMAGLVGGGEDPPNPLDPVMEHLAQMDGGAAMPSGSMVDGSSAGAEPGIFAPPPTAEGNRAGVLAANRADFNTGLEGLTPEQQQAARLAEAGVPTEEPYQPNNQRFTGPDGETFIADMNKMGGQAWDTYTPPPLDREPRAPTTEVMGDRTMQWIPETKTWEDVGEARRGAASSAPVRRGAAGNAAATLKQRDEAVFRKFGKSRVELGYGPVRVEVAEFLKEYDAQFGIVEADLIREASSPFEGGLGEMSQPPNPADAAPTTLTAPVDPEAAADDEFEQILRKFRMGSPMTPEEIATFRRGAGVP